MGNRPYVWQGEETHQYDDIIDLPHPNPSIRPRMSLMERAAQFAPFAALVGYGDEVDEVTRLTDVRLDLTEEELSALNQMLNELMELCATALSKRKAGEAFRFPQVTVTYFLPDSKKSGGSYVQQSGLLKRVDPVEGVLIFTDSKAVPISDVIDISVEGGSLASDKSKTRVFRKSE